MPASGRAEAPKDLGSDKLSIKSVVPIDGDRKVAKFTCGRLRVDSLWLTRCDDGWRCSWPHGQRGFPIVTPTDPDFDAEILSAVHKWEAARGASD